MPLLTENCLKLLKTFCQDERRFYFSMSTLKDLIMTRFAQRQVLLNLLLEFTHNKNAIIRSNAITISLKLWEHDEYRVIIEVFKSFLKFKYCIINFIFKSLKNIQKL